MMMSAQYSSLLYMSICSYTSTMYYKPNEHEQKAVRKVKIHFAQLSLYLFKTFVLKVNWKRLPFNDNSTSG